MAHQAHQAHKRVRSANLLFLVSSSRVLSVTAFSRLCLETIRPWVFPPCTIRGNTKPSCRTYSVVGITRSPHPSRTSATHSTDLIVGTFVSSTGQPPSPINIFLDCRGLAMAFRQSLRLALSKGPDIDYTPMVEDDVLGPMSVWLQVPPKKAG